MSVTLIFFGLVIVEADGPELPHENTFAIPSASIDARASRYIVLVLSQFVGTPVG